jgi:hypothetical protein
LAGLRDDVNLGLIDEVNSGLIDEVNCGLRLEVNLGSRLVGMSANTLAARKNTRNRMQVFMRGKFGWK